MNTDLINNAGRQAYFYGQSRETNPYRQEGPHREAWFQGYDAPLNSER